jgi:hypothetical protein
MKRALPVAILIAMTASLATVAALRDRAASSASASPTPSQAAVTVPQEVSQALAMLASRVGLSVGPPRAAITRDGVTVYVASASTGEQCLAFWAGKGYSGGGCEATAGRPLLRVMPLPLGGSALVGNLGPNPARLMVTDAAGAQATVSLLGSVSGVTADGFGVVPLSADMAEALNAGADLRIDHGGGRPPDVFAGGGRPIGGS